MKSRVLNQIELNIYGQDDEIIATYVNKRIRMGVLERACELEEELENKTPIEMLYTLKSVFFEVFDGLTEEHYKLADFRDLMSAYTMVLSMAKNL